MLFRKDKTIERNSFSTAEEYYSAVRSGMREKANHNKNESQGCFLAVIICTLLAPLFVSYGEGIIWGKIVPSILSVFAAGVTSWLQLRKPQRLWTLYRRAQRHLEQIKADHDFDDGDFEGVADKGKLLSRKVTEIARRVHDEWEGLVPDPEALGNERSRKSLGKKNENRNS